MTLENGMRVLLRGRYEDFTEHLSECIVTIVDCEVDSQGYIQIADAEGTWWYVQAIDVFPAEVST